MNEDRFELTYVGITAIIWDTLEYRVVYEGDGIRGQTVASSLVYRLNNHWRDTQAKSAR